MEAHVCNHPLVPHTVIYSLGKASVVKEFDDLEDADQFGQKIIRQNSGRLSWLKIHRTDNESYSCFFWESPQRRGEMKSTEKVKLEVDMEPLASVFENIGIGFKEQGNRIKWLTISQGGVLVAITALAIDRIF